MRNSNTRKLLDFYSWKQKIFLNRGVAQKVQWFTKTLFALHKFDHLKIPTSWFQKEKVS